MGADKKLEEQVLVKSRERDNVEVGFPCSSHLLHECLPDSCLYVRKTSTRMNSFWWGSNADGNRGIKWFAWERMCTSKRDGGMGFRYLRNFNVAMLGKQEWRFTTEIDTLSFRVFKAKYFPNGDFLNATLGSSPSFIWKSISSSQAVLRHGAWWRVGNGDTIRVWSDPWIPRDDNFYVSQVPRSCDMELRVNSLFRNDGAGWDSFKLREILATVDVKAVLKIPVSRMNYSDKRIWHFDKHGRYSVKSAYHEANNIFKIRDCGRIRVNWRKLWNLKIPPKVKDFAWRALHNALPSKTKLISRGVQLETQCCSRTEDEDLTHTLLSCSRAQNCWRYWPHYNLIGSSDFSDMLAQLINNNIVDIAVEFCIISWSVWCARNAKLWRDENQFPRFMYQEAMKSLTSGRMHRPSNKSICRFKLLRLVILGCKQNQISVGYVLRILPFLKTKGSRVMALFVAHILGNFKRQSRALLTEFINQKFWK